MAPFTIYPHHPLPYQCRLPPGDLYMQSKMSLESSIKMPGTHEDLPLSPYHRISIFSMLLKVRVHLWQVMRRVVNCCMSVTELISSKMFFFICVGKNIAMTGKLKKSGVEAQERPGWEFGNGSVGSVNIDKELEDPEMKVVMELDKEELIEPAEKQESSVNNSDEEDDDEDTRLSEWIEWESEEETDDGSEDEDEEEEDNEEHTQEEDWESERVEDEDSEWSDDDEDDSEGSAESLELWESFLNSSDPYNPLSFSSSTGSRTNTINTPQNQQTQCLQNKQVKPTTAAEEHPNYSKANTKDGGKKVCFSDKVTVHPLVAWSFASRSARDGSCWLQMARDRERFRRRVKNIEEVIKPCLTPEHRACVWEKLKK